MDEFRVMGLSVPITRSQSQNAVICQRFWRTFNSELAAAKVRQRGNWRKYAITYSEAETYRYLCGIPDESTLPGPTHFETMAVPAGIYLVFDHVGPATDIIATLSTIYRRQLPILGFQPSHLAVFHLTYRRKPGPSGPGGRRSELRGRPEVRVRPVGRGRDRIRIHVVPLCKDLFLAECPGK
ncbi:hypothetical protein B2J88_44330 [Rhodococcus sp. SRB_17]|nr:hypothetical protein [Rhodococcus sp. SRB_17]